MRQDKDKDKRCKATRAAALLVPAARPVLFLVCNHNHSSVQLSSAQLRSCSAEVFLLSPERWNATHSLYENKGPAGMWKRK